MITNFQQPLNSIEVGGSPFSTPSSLIIGELTNDGFPEIITANSGNMSALRNISQGQADIVFGPSVELLVEDGAHLSLAAGDFGGNNLLDIAVTTASSQLGSKLGIFINTFSAFGIDFSEPRIIDLGTTDPIRLTAGDINTDGKPDLILANQDQPEIGVLLGLGDGQFAEEIKLSVTEPPKEVVLGDLNGDGLPDLALVDGVAVTVLLGLGNGGFIAGGTFSVGEGPQALVIVDIDGDDFPDLVTANIASDDVSILLFDP